MTICYLGLGSNLRTPKRQMHQALRLLMNLPKTTLKKKSPLIQSEPSGVRGQPTYINAVVMLKTQLPPLSLLKHCQAIEKKQGRVRKKKWGARTLDIDLLLYGNRTLNKPRLTIPHPRLTQRDFMLTPLLTLDEHVCLPDGSSVLEHQKRISNHVFY